MFTITIYVVIGICINCSLGCCWIALFLLEFDLARHLSFALTLIFFLIFWDFLVWVNNKIIFWRANQLINLLENDCFMAYHMVQSYRIAMLIYPPYNAFVPYLLLWSVVSENHKRIWFIKLNLIAISENMLLAATNLASNTLSLMVVLIKQCFVLQFHEFLKILFVFSDHIQEPISSNFYDLRELRAHSVHGFICACQEAVHAETFTFLKILYILPPALRIGVLPLFACKSIGF